MSESIQQPLSKDEMCETTAYQSAAICVPITLTPFANAGATSTKCCGKPVVTSEKKECEGIKNGSCTFTISQNICVGVPVSLELMQS